jgi:sugar phosphate isomerase/epimerase
MKTSLLTLALFLSIGVGLVSAAERTRLFPEPPGMVSYTYRNQFKDDVPGTLDVIRRLGVTDMEFSNLFGKTAEELRALLDERGMTCSSFGVSYDDAKNKTAQVARNARTLGARYVRVASIPHEPPFTLETVRATATDFNRIGRELKEKHDLTFCYHNHGYEFVPHGDGTLFDVLLAETDPRYVGIELDLLWTYLPGQDPAALIEKYPDRIKLMHLKDLKKGVPSNHTGKTPVENDVALGTGQLDLPRILRAARKAGVAHYYIEDESPSIATQVPASLRYLAGLTE